MSDEAQAFREFEKAGWEDEGVCVTYDALFSGLTKLSIPVLLESAAVGPGKRVLDVATGAGYVAHAAAELGAETVGVDLSATQIEMARKRYPDLTFDQCDADSLPFPDGSAETGFDAVVNNYGMGHVPEPEGAFNEAFRVLKRGGWFAFAVPNTPDKSAVFGILYGSIGAHGSMDVGLPPGPSYFLFSNPDTSEQHFSAAGFHSFAVTTVQGLWKLPSTDALIETFMEGTVRGTATLKAQTPQALEAILASIREGAAQYQVGEGLELPTSSLVLAGEKP